MPSRPDLRELASNVKDAFADADRETLLDVLTFVIKEYVVEGPPPMLIHQAETLSDLRAPTFAQLITALQTRFDHPELSMFVVDGEQVSVRIGNAVHPLLPARQPLGGTAAELPRPQVGVHVVETTLAPRPPPPARRHRPRRAPRRRRAPGSRSAPSRPGAAVSAPAAARRPSDPRRRPPDRRPRHRRRRAPAAPAARRQARAERRRRVGAVQPAGARLMSAVARRYYERGRSALEAERSRSRRRKRCAPRSTSRRRSATRGSPTPSRWRGPATARARRPCCAPGSGGRRRRSRRRRCTRRSATC